MSQLLPLAGASITRLHYPTMRGQAAVSVSRRAGSPRELQSKSALLDCTVAARPALGAAALRRGDKWPLTPQPLSPIPPPTLPGREGLKTNTVHLGERRLSRSVRLLARQGWKHPGV